MNNKTVWHSIAIKDVTQKLNSNPLKGLSDKEVVKRLKSSGENVLPKDAPLTKVMILLGQFKSPLIYILVIAGIVVLFFKEYTDAIVIFGAVFLNIIVGYIQENKASDALEKLKKIVKISASVIRNGQKKIIDSSLLVPGDILILSPGNKVPADGRIIESDNFKVNEMALTGEWLPAEKNNKKIDKKTSLADRDNMVYMGTIIDDGTARVIVTETGVKTEIGKIAKLIKETKEEKTPLQKKVARFSVLIGIIIGIISLIILVEGLITGKDFIEIFTIVVAVSVAAIPEGLPIAVTVILAIGMSRILKKQGLVRKLAAAETLGSTSIIATDKTGTLTEGKMTVSEIVTYQEKNRDKIIEIAALCSDAFIENPDASKDKWIVRGRPTDKALLIAGMSIGIDKNKLESEMKLIKEVPFNSINKYMTKTYLVNKKKRLLVLGAPEKLLTMSKFSSKTVKSDLEKLTKKGLRVLAVGYKEGSDTLSDLKFAGLIALKDPIRPEVKSAILATKQAGMKTIIVTGDHKLTAKAVALELGFKIEDKNIIEGSELDNISDKKLEKLVDDIIIYARVEPKHKLRIISAWQNKGHVIAMTGDGINDAPALKKADIGVAIGSGTEVAKDVSDLILLSDNFNVIVAAVEEGRGIMDNVRKVITYLLSDSFTEVILVALALLFGFPLPLTAAQILWVNLIEDGLPGMALAFEPKEKDIMKRKPLPKDEPLLNKEMKILIFIIGIVTDVFLLVLFFWLVKNSNYSIEHIRTIIFAALAVDSLMYVFSCKSLRKNIWHINIFNNKFLIYAWAFGVVTLLAAIYIPQLQILLKTYPLGGIDWTVIIALGLIELILIEFVKWLFITRKLKN